VVCVVVLHTRDDALETSPVIPRIEPVDRAFVDHRSAGVRPAGAMDSSRRSSARNRTCSSTARASPCRGLPAMRRNRSLMAQTCSSIRGGGGDSGGRLGFQAPSWRIGSRSLSATTARMFLVRTMFGLYDVALHTAGPRRHSAAVRRSRDATFGDTIRSLWPVRLPRARNAPRTSDSCESESADRALFHAPQRKPII